MDNGNDDDNNGDELNRTLTDESQFFTDDFNKNEIKLSNSNELIHKNELYNRWNSAQKAIDSSEKCINDLLSSISKINLNNSKAINYECLPKHIQEDTKSSITCIQDYIKKLEDQFKDLDNADKQIDKTSEKVLQDIDVTYEHLKTQIIQKINEKRDLLKLEAQVFKSESLSPLKACRKEIHAEILQKKQLIQKIYKACNECKNINNTELVELISADQNIGGIPAVPLSEELPHLTFKQPSEAELNDTLGKIYSLGSVLHLGPVQIVDVEEKPASLFVKWEVTLPEYAAEELNYILQKANGEIVDPTSDVFQTVYEGPETSCFVKDLLFNRPVTFRVGIQSLESAWSSHYITSTRVPNYRWNDDNDDYLVTNNGRIVATKSDKLSTIFSKEPQIESNQIIEFQLLDCPKNVSNDEGIALVADPHGKDDDLKRKKVLFVTCQGKIFMNGDEKLMQLPKIQPGVRLIFTITKNNNKSLRINIECLNKVVTYDWLINTPLYFAARLAGYNKWNLLVK